MDNLIVILLVSLAPLSVAVLTAVNAKKSNAAWRERRLAKAAARASDVVEGRTAH